MAYRLSQDEIKVTSILGRKLSTPTLDVLHPSHFAYRHIGPRRADVEEMLDLLGYSSLESFIDAVVPEEIRLRRPLALPPGRSEREVLQALRGLAGMNRVFRSFIGMGYAGCFTPQVIQRNVLENPGWYTAYTPYQAEIAQGRLEALLNFQTVVSDLTGLEVANASLLDEATAAAEAMNLSLAVRSARGQPVYLVDDRCHPQTIAVVRTRAEARGIMVRLADPTTFTFDPDVIGALVQYPATDGEVRDFRAVCERAHAAGALVTAATDLLSLTLLTPPGEWGADVAVGNSQRFGVPMGYGGPHAAFFATKEAYKRYLPGRIIGVSKDRDGRPALRMALQTREQHIRRDKATSNVCTAQVLLAVMASMYAVYHGPAGLRRIAERVHARTVILANALRRLGYRVVYEDYFDTICVEAEGWALPRLLDAARVRNINLRQLSPTRLCVALDETVTLGDVADLITIFSLNEALPFMLEDIGTKRERAIPKALSPDQLLPRAPGVPPAPFRNRDAPLHQAAGSQGPVIDLGDDSAGVLHHEAERHYRDDAGELERVQPAAPVCPAGSGRRVSAAVQPTGVSAGGDHRICVGVAAAQRRVSGRIRRAPRDPCLPPLPGRIAPHHLPHSAVGPRHQSRQRRNGRDAGGGREERRPGQHRPGRSQSQGGETPGDSGRADDHLSLDPRRVRRVSAGDLPGDSRAWRAGVHGWRQHERAGGSLPSGRHRSRRVPPEPS